MVVNAREDAEILNCIWQYRSLVNDEFIRIMVSVQCRNMRNRIFRKKEYSLLEQVPISVADSNALAVRNYKGTE